MLKLVLVGVGDNHALKQYTDMLKEKIQGFVKQNNFRFYNCDRISRAEADPSLLKRNSPLFFPIKSCDFRSYWGVRGDTDIPELYTRWLAPHSPDDVLRSWFEEVSKHFNQKIPAYDKSYMISRIRKLHESFLQETGNSSLCDLDIDYECRSLTNTENVCTVKISLNSSEKYQPPIDFFRDIIENADRDFGEVFLSAYITQTLPKDLEVAGDIRYQPELLESKIIDTGYMFYISEKIKKENGLSETENCRDYIATKLLNGDLYTYTGAIQNVYNAWSAVADSAIIKLLVPRYRHISWRSFCGFEEYPISEKEQLSIYYSSDFPTCPEFVFSYGYTPEQLDMQFADYYTEKTERYNIKDFL